MSLRFVAGLGCIVMLFAASVVGVAYGQNDQATAGGSGQLEEIVVTARKTEEKLQVAPVSVTALTATKLDEQNVTTAAGINGLVPNLQITQGSGYGTSLNVTIRGVNQADDVLTNDSPVALYIDGVYNGRAMGGLFDLVDLERVEVLRGPQGTLFGRNTTGGAINFITKGPTDTFSIEEQVSYGSYNDFRTRTEVNTGLIADTGLKALIAYTHHQNDGYVRNLLTAPDDGFGSVDSDAFYFALHGDLTDALSFDYRIDYTHEHDQPLAESLTYASPADIAYFGASPKFGGAPLILSNTRLGTDSVYNANPPNLDEVYGHSLTVEYDVSDALRLKSISAYRSFADDSHSDQSGQGLLLGPVLNASFGYGGVQQVGLFQTLCPGDTPSFPSNTCDHQRQYQLSEEFQATGTFDEFKYVGGLFFFDEHVHEQDPEFLTVVEPCYFFGVCAQPAVAAAGGNVGIQAYPVTSYYSESKSFAAYGQTSYRPDFLDDKFEFTFGMRYTFDQKTIQQKDFSATAPGCYTDSLNPLVPCAPYFGAKNFHNISWLLSGNYQFTDDIMGYWRIANAYKSGGFSARTPGDEYNPETDTSYEVGVKSEFFDHHVRVNADVFYTQYDNEQINVFVENPVTHAAASVTTNAGSVDYTGGELEFNIIPVKNLLIGGSFGYVSPNFNQFLSVNPATGLVQNYASQAIDNYVSKETYDINVEYDFDPFSFGDLVVSSTYSFQSPETFHPLTVLEPLNPIIKSTNYHTLRAFILLKNIDTSYGTWQAKLYGDNLIDQNQRYAGIDFGIAPGSSFGNNSYNPPRTIGFQLTYNFAPGESAGPAPAAYAPPPPQPVAPAPAVAHSYMVFFDFNKSDLTPDAVRIVDQAAANAAPAKATELVVTGHTDTVGSDAYNMRLSRRRAEAVAAELEKQGIASAEIEIVAKGKHDLLVPTGDGVREPQNRRVTIVYGGGATS